jgi:hypothetical protein
MALCSIIIPEQLIGSVINSSVSVISEYQRVSQNCNAGLWNSAFHCGALISIFVTSCFTPHITQQVVEENATHCFEDCNFIIHIENKYRQYASRLLNFYTLTCDFH